MYGKYPNVVFEFESTTVSFSISDKDIVDALKKFFSLLYIQGSRGGLDRNVDVKFNKADSPYIEVKKK